jgi:NADPH2:quinone reductase
MKAVAYKEKGPIDRPDSLFDCELPIPVADDHDLLVKVSAISVNPVDFKIRSWLSAPDDEPRVLGWDAVGIVVKLGPLACGFAVGDRIYYSGEVLRQGANAEYNLVDCRLAALAPTTFSDVEAAALPLASLTAWQVLFQRMEVQRPVSGAAPAVVIIGAAGGVGSMSIQLLRAMTDLTVIATAGRKASKGWCLGMGAHHVLDHTIPIAAQVAALGLGQPGFVLSVADSQNHRDQSIELLAPQGRFAFIDDPESFDVIPFKRKSISVHLQAVFVRAEFRTPDMAEDGAFLQTLAGLVDSGKVRTTVTTHFGKITAANLKAAHSLLERGHVHGKVVLEGF